MRILCDTNVVLDVLLRREPWYADGLAILKAGDDNQCICCLSALSIANIFYVGRRQVGTERSRAAISDLLDRFEIVPVDRVTLEIANAMRGSDFEDNVQSACAVLGRTNFIVTRDPRGFQHSRVMTITPGELRERMRTAWSGGTIEPT